MGTARNSLGLFRGFHSYVLVIMGVFILSFSNCGKPTSQDESKDLDRANPVQEFGKYTAYQLYSDAFETLDFNNKLFAFYLTRASLALRDVSYDQRGLNNLQLRKIIDIAMFHKNELPYEQQQALEKFAFELWRNNGIYDYQKAQAIPLEISPEMLRNSMLLAMKHSFNLINESQVDHLIEYLYDFYEVMSIKGNEHHYNNFYSHHITSSDIVHYKESRGPHTRLLKYDNDVFEEVYCAGTPDIAPGRMSENIGRAVVELENALTVAPSASRPALMELIQFLRSANYEHFKRHQRLLREDTSPVRYLMGFFGTSDDSFNKRGTIGAGVFVLRDDGKYDAIFLTGYFAPWVSDKSFFDGSREEGILCANLDGNLIINADLVAIRNRMGGIRDIVISYPRDFLEQMLNYSAYQHSALD